MIKKFFIFKHNPSMGEFVIPGMSTDQDVIDLLNLHNKTKRQDNDFAKGGIIYPNGTDLQNISGHKRSKQSIEAEPHLIEDAIIDE